VAAAILRAGETGDEMIALVERPEGGTLARFLELPAVDVGAEADPRAVLAGRLRELGAQEVAIGEAVARVEHGMFNRRALVTAYAAAARFDRASPIRILPSSELREHPITTQSRKILLAIAGTDGRGPAPRRRRQAARP
jgi:hypothetical protein